MEMEKVNLPDDNGQDSAVELDVAVERVWSEGFCMDRLPDIKAPYPEEDVLRATAWVLDVFEDFIVYEADAPDEARLMEFDHVISDEDVRTGFIFPSSKDAIRVNMPVGTQMRHWVRADLFAKLYISIILDDSIPPDEKINTIIRYDDHHGLLHARFLRSWKERGEI